MDEKRLRYNNIPVKYCPQCLSLHIRAIQDCEYCYECGNGVLSEAHINQWRVFKEGRGEFNFK